jgi:hypothetical protein
MTDARQERGIQIAKVAAYRGDDTAASKKLPEGGPLVGLGDTPRLCNIRVIHLPDLAIGDMPRHHGPSAK